MKATEEKATANKATAEKATAEKATAEQATAEQATAKQATAKKATAKKATAKKATAKKATAKKATAKKATAKKANVPRGRADAVSTQVLPAGKPTSRRPATTKVPEVFYAPDGRALVFQEGSARSATPAEVKRAQKAQELQVQKERDRRVRMLKNHMPTDSAGPFTLEEIADGVRDSRPIEVIVLAVDIRRSTYVMKEVVNFVSFARAISSFIGETRSQLSTNGGWWDKFTGDGFLAYWLYRPGQSSADLYGAAGPTNQALATALRLLRSFEHTTVPALRMNSRNFPAGVGLSVGLDAGPAHIVEIAGELTVVGPPVVGAVRMVNAARPWEMIANNYLGEWIQRAPLEFKAVELARREYRQTKEYDSQEIYVLDLHGFTPPECGLDGISQ